MLGSWYILHCYQVVKKTEDYVNMDFSHIGDDSPHHVFDVYPPAELCNLLPVSVTVMGEVCSVVCVCVCARTHAHFVVCVCMRAHACVCCHFMYKLCKHFTKLGDKRRKRYDVTTLLHLNPDKSELLSITVSPLSSEIMVQLS